jgi:alpha-beta hydrolase superfamily lysophospholipase
MRYAWRELGVRGASAGLLASLILAAASLSAQQPRPNPPPQGQPRTPPVEGKASKTKTQPGGLRLPGGELPGDLKADPLPKEEADAAEIKKSVAAGPVVPIWPYHYSLQIAAFDNVPLAVRYYPARQGGTAPVVLLVHESGAGRSGKDFEEPIAELKNQGLAPYLQSQGYAVLVVDLRGYGANQKKSLSPEQWRATTFDLQAAYHFLIDRHNRRELNLSKLGVVAVGEGANLAASWVATPGGAVSIEGRLADLAAVALISPLGEDRGLRLAPTVAALAPRFPMLLVAGQGDAPSADAVKEVQPTVERQRQGRVAFIESRQRGANLLRFAPGATTPLLRFLENALKARADDWEPRYNLQPVAFANVHVVNDGDAPAIADPPAEAAKTAPAKKAVNP